MPSEAKRFLSLLLAFLTGTAVTVFVVHHYVAPNIPSASGKPLDEAKWVEVQNRLSQLAFAIEKLSEKSDAPDPKGEKLQQIFDRVDELGSQIYTLGSDTQRQLMTLQQNVLRRLTEISVASAPAKEMAPEELKEKLAKEGVELLFSSKIVKIQGRVVSPDRPIEVAAAVEGGPTHESLFELACQPSALRQALLALGAKTGHGPDYRNNAVPTGSPIYVYVTWEGLDKPFRLEDLIKDMRNGLEMRNCGWVFAGSEYTTDFRSGKEFYVPDVTRVAIALTWNFGDGAVLASDHVDAANENIWAPNIDLFPSVDELNVTFILSTERQPIYERERPKLPNPTPATDK